MKGVFPAFPSPHDEKMYGPMDKGMTLRDFFAATAMQGDWASQSSDTGEFVNEKSDRVYAQRAVEYYKAADAMMKARSDAAPEQSTKEKP